MSPLERACHILGETLRAAEFGRQLQAFHPSRRGGDLSPSSLRMYEVNSGPAIRRTMQTIVMTGIAGEPLALTDEDRVYIDWIKKAHLVVQRIAGRCWAPMPPDLRILVLDEDDLGPHGSPYLTGTREFTPGPHLRFAEVDSLPVAEAINDLVRACQATACYACALNEITRVKADRVLRNRLHARRQRTIRRIEPKPGMTIGEVQSRAREAVAAAYDDCDPPMIAVARSVRAYNQLVNYALWAVLGFAEQETTIRFGQEASPIRARRSHRSLWVHFAVSDFEPFIGQPPAPFLLESNSPVDGLYILEGARFSFSGRELVDVHGRRTRDLEEAPEGHEPNT